MLSTAITLRFLIVFRELAQRSLTPERREIRGTRFAELYPVTYVHPSVYPSSEIRSCRSTEGYRANSRFIIHNQILFRKECSPRDHIHCFSLFWEFPGPCYLDPVHAGCQTNIKLLFQNTLAFWFYHARPKSKTIIVICTGCWLMMPTKYQIIMRFCLYAPKDEFLSQNRWMKGWCIGRCH